MLNLAHSCSWIRSARSLCLGGLITITALGPGCKFEGSFGSGGGSSGGSSGGGGGSGIETQGVFHGGRIVGLHYETPSFSGLTDSDGRYRYRDGEAVLFSLGGIELGSARGEPELDLFDLVGADPILDEAEIRAALGNRLRVDDLDRVANIARLLVTLDRDRDPDNGIDLTDWDSELTDYLIDFAFDLFFFPERRGLDTLTAVRTAFAIEYEVALAVPLLFTYEALGLQVPAHIAVRETLDIGDDESIEEEIVTTYNDLGLRKTLRRTENPGAGDFPIQHTRFEYDADGRVVLEDEEIDSRGDGFADNIRRTEIAYADSGLLLTSITELGDPLLYQRSGFAYGYDDGGNQTRERFERDDGPNGIADRIEEIVQRYDENGLPLELVQEEDVDADGRLERRLRIEYDYSRAGLKIAEIIERDGGTTPVDGIVDARVDIVFQYDSQDRLSRETRRLDDNGDGIVESEVVIRFRYNSDDRVLEQERQTDDGVDGILDSQWIIRFEYDSDDRLARVTIEDDSNGDALVDRTYVTDFEYNDVGLLLLRETVRRNDVGVVESTFVDRRRYGDSGELVTRFTGTEGRTGTFVEPVRQRWEYRTIDDGLRYLIQHFRFLREEEFSPIEPCAVVLQVGGVVTCSPL